MATETFILNPIFIKNVVKKLLVELKYNSTEMPWKSIETIEIMAISETG